MGETDLQMKLNVPDFFFVQSPFERDDSYRLTRRFDKFCDLWHFL